MPILTLSITPNSIAAGLLPEPQVCYALLTIAAGGGDGVRPVNWALVADASRSMRIPIVDEEQFRALIREGGAQEVLVDGVPVWQLSSPVPPEVRAATRSALDHVARALHSVVERLDDQDRFALVACAEEAVLLTRSASGAAQADLARGIGRLASLNLGEQTDLARGIEMALGELRHGRDVTGASQHVERLLLMTDGFTQRPEACLALASVAAAEGIAISTIGLGGEFQEEVLTELADRSGGRALFLSKPEEIPRTVAAELDAARAVAARAVALHIAPAEGVVLRRATRIRPALATLYEDMATMSPASLPLGDIAAGAVVTLLLEFLAPPQASGRAALAQLTLTSAGAPATAATLFVTHQANVPAYPPELLDAAARAAAARLQRRALATASIGAPGEAARLMRAAATRFEALGERGLADAARDQAAAIEQGRAADPLASKRLTYATRRLGGE